MPSAASIKAPTRSAPVRDFSADFEQKVRERAYELYEQRGREDGHDVEDWFRAEEELTQRTLRPAA